MDVAENHIKEIIINKYGSLKKFCEIIDMPWTTLDSILKRGFSNSNITNVMKISHELKVDTESLASGKIIACIERTESKKDNSSKIMQYYELLNDIGKHVATERVKELTEVPRYVNEETYVNAAHPIDDASEDDKQFDEDIMDDKNF